MTWQWIALIGIVAFWTISLQVIHGWIRVNQIRMTAVYASMDPETLDRVQMKTVAEGE